MTDATSTLNLPPDPETPSVPTVVDIPATPASPAVTVSDIPTITLPWTKATKAHVGAALATVTGGGEIAAQFLPDGPVKAYVTAAVAVAGIIAIWLGVYVIPNVPKVTKD